MASGTLTQRAPKTQHEQQIDDGLVVNVHAVGHIVPAQQPVAQGIGGKRRGERQDAQGDEQQRIQ
jgi:hypothetical protein